jgi:hypothetical protein
VGRQVLPKATADTCIFIWLAGGMCHVDTFDPKPKGDGGKVAGSYFAAIKTCVPGIEVSEHLPQVAARMDRFAVLKTLHHEFPNHSTGVDFAHTGRVATGTVVYPSIGSLVAHELGGFDPKAPPYVVVGYPMKPRGPGYLGGRYNYVYITDTEASPAGLEPPKGLTREDYERRLEGLEAFSRPYLDERAPHSEVEEYEATARKGFEMMGEKFQSAFSVKAEPAGLREAYGEEFGQRLLLSRRLVQHGIRFVECSFNLHFINGYGWDTHDFAQKRVHLIIHQLDRGLAVLVDDLEKHKMLDRTLIVVATEFGRPPDFDGGGGRGHQSTAFCAVLLGGGIRGGRTVGVTDELGREIKERPISIPDFHATIHRALGIDPVKPLITPDNRPVPITDYGKPIEELFA